MLGRIFTVGGLTLVSRVTGFVRDVVLAAVLGAGPMADAFFVALRLPNHFRAIFAEGAFNAAFVPAYARVRTQGGADPARLFANRVFTMLVAAEAVLLALALLFTPAMIRLLAPGFASDPGQFALAVELTRITFPYLLLVSLVTLYGGMLNAVQCFASPAAAPVLLNVTMIATLGLAWMFPSAGHAAAWGVLIAGVLEVLLVGADTARRTGLPRFAALSLDDDVKRFFKALGPATLGSAGLQIALFADTIIATFLASGAISALYYADRLNQLPIGVIGIAVGTVVLPEMANRLAGGDAAGARAAQARAIELALFLSVPCLVAFVLVPEAIMAGLFRRGAFTAADASAAGATLRAYAIGLLPFVLIRSVTATFLARGDTATPVKAMLVGVLVNVLLKIALMGSLAQVGLALATSVGAWVNFGLVVWFAHRAGLLGLEPRLRSAILKLALAGAVTAAALVGGDRALAGLVDARHGFDAVIRLAGLAGIGALVYSAMVAVLFGRSVLAGLRRRKAAPPAPVPPSGTD